LLVKEPEAYRGQWLDVASNERQGQCPDGSRKIRYSELHIEVGCGKGRFTVDTAKAESGTEAGSGVFIAALEKSADAMIIALERAAAEELQNIRFINAYADDLTDYFAPGEASRIYLNFCDPWPSNRHIKRRLTNRRFLELYMEILRPGGEIRFKTDNLPLFEYSLKEFGYYGFTLFDIGRDLHRDGPVGVMTDYELKFYDLGLPIYGCVARK
jgi:tRNA (guanine-N7-)-methyltransferase